MRRFDSTPVVGLRTPGGGVLTAWVAEALQTRLAGLAGADRLPAGRALVIPRCASVHTIGMRFAIDVAFVSWPAAGDECEVAAIFEQVRPLRVVSLRDSRRRGLAALETPAGKLRALGVEQGARLTVVFAQRRRGHKNGCIT